MSQSALADAIGVTRQTIIAIEQGRYSPSLESAFRISRVFGVDVLKCSRCQGQMQLIACIEEPDVAKKILEHLGLRAEPLPTLRAQAPPVTLDLFPAA